MKKIIIISIISAIVLAACSFKPDCVTENFEGMVISWGEQNKINQEIRGYTLTDKGKIYYYERMPDDTDIKMVKLVKVKDDEFCDVLQYTIQGFVKNQVFNAPGVVVRFIEFRTPATRGVFRAIWNPSFKKNGSVDFVKMYEKLMALVPDENENKEYMLREVKSDEAQFQLPLKEKKDDTANESINEE